MTKVGICLSGCGVKDGSEIHESVITILALNRAGADVKFMAPNMDQLMVVDHLTGNAVEETRNVLVESARIARGEIVDLATVTARDMDALIFPGGFGAALNLCNFGVKGADCDIHPQVTRIIKEMITAKKPIGVICIAPAMMSRALKDLDLHPKLTIGKDEGTAGNMEKMGAVHISCPAKEFVIDERYKIVSTPAYMEAGSISEAAEGIEKLVGKVLELIQT